MTGGFQYAERRAPIGLLLCMALLAVLAAGCGASETPKSDFTIAIAAPTSGPLGDRGQDMIDAARLALEVIDSDTETTRLTLDVANRAKPGALAAISALAPIAADGALTIDLSSPPEAVELEDRIWLLPSAESNGTAIGQFAAAAMPRSLDPVVGDSEFDGAVKRGVQAVVESAGLSTGAAALPVAGLGYAGAMADDRLIVADNPMTAGVPEYTYVTPALSEENYPPAGKRFFDSFIEEYGRAPDRFAIYAYEAVGLVVDAINRLEDAGEPVSPSNVQRSAFSIKNRFSPVGHYDVLPNGTTTLFVFQACGKDAPPPESALIEVRR